MGRISSNFLLGLVLSVLSIFVPFTAIFAVVFFWLCLFDFAPDTKSSHILSKSPPKSEVHANDRTKSLKSSKSQVRKSPWGVPTLRVRDTTGKLIEVNAETPVSFETEYFKGKVLIMVKCDGQLSAYDHYKYYFEGKQRRFDIQIQGQFKHIPRGTMMLGGEVEGIVSLDANFLGRIANLLLGICTKLIPYTHYCYGEESSSDGLYQRAHLCFPVFKAMDRMVITEPGETPPELGRDLPESDHDRKIRRTKADSDNLADAEKVFRRGPTYSFSFHSNYIDFSTWKVRSIPGLMRPIDISSFIKLQPIQVVMYEIDRHLTMEQASQQPHYMRSKKYISVFELSHLAIMSEEEILEEEQLARLQQQQEEDGNEDEDGGAGSGVGGIGGRFKLLPTSPLAPSTDAVEGDSIFGAMFGRRSTTGPGSNMYSKYQGGWDEPHKMGEVAVLSNSVTPWMVLPAPWEYAPRCSVNEEHTSSNVIETPMAAGIAVAGVASDGMVLISPHEKLAMGGLITPGGVSNVAGSGVPSPVGHGGGAVGFTGSAGVGFVDEYGMMSASAPQALVDNNAGSMGSSSACLSNLLGWQGIGVAEESSVRVELPEVQMIRLVRVKQELYPDSHNRGRSYSSMSDVHSDVIPQPVGAGTALLGPRGVQMGLHKASGQARGGVDDAGGPSMPDPDPNMLRCGDVVKVLLVDHGSYLIVHKGWWIGQSSEVPEDPHGYFQISILDTDGRVRYGAPLTTGKPFRLRSAKWPRYEVGCIFRESQVGKVGPGTEPFLVLYEWNPKKFVKGPMKWVYNDTSVNPMVFCVLNASHRSIESSSPAPFDPKPIVASSPSPPNTATATATGSPSRKPNAAFEPKKGQREGQQSHPSSGLAAVGSPTSPSYTKDYIIQQFLSSNPVVPFRTCAIKIPSWVYFLHRTTQMRAVAFVVTCTLVTLDGFITSWTSFRTIREVDLMLSTVEEVSGLGPFAPYGSAPSLGLSGRELRGPREEAALEAQVRVHQSPIDQLLRMFKCRMRRVFNHAARVRAIVAATGASTKGSNASQAQNFDFLTECEDEDDEVVLDFQDQNVTPVDRRLFPLYALQGKGSIFGGGAHMVSPEERKARQSRLSAQKSMVAHLKRPRTVDSWVLSRVLEQESVTRAADDKLFAKATAHLSMMSRGKPAQISFSAIVLRSVWEGHWCEDLAVITDNAIAFFAPLSSSHSFMLALVDVTSVRAVPAVESPLPGLFPMRLESLGRVHYLCFNCEETRDEMTTNLLRCMSSISFQTSFKASDPIQSLGLRSGRWMTPHGRIVLNSRDLLMFHDREPNARGRAAKLLPEWRLSVELLRQAFQLGTVASYLGGPGEGFDDEGDEVFRPNLPPSMGAPSTYDGAPFSGESEERLFTDGSSLSREQLMDFFDAVSDLKHVRLSSINVYSPEALCFFVNIYHTLLLHARIVIGPPNKQTWAQWFSTVSYEIGDDVFSLTEIEHCVVRGGSLSKYRGITRQLSKRTSPAPAPNDPHYAYALYHADRRGNFLLNSTSVSHPNSIYLLTPSTLDMQLELATLEVITHDIIIDYMKKAVSLPKACDVFLGDAIVDSEADGNASNDIKTLKLSYRYVERLGGHVKMELDKFMKVVDERFMTVKFAKFVCEARECLRMKG